MDFQGTKIAHDLCREIQKSEGRERLQDIFTQRSTRTGNFGMNREHVEYRWRIEHAQFLTPLILNQEREQLSQMPFSDDVMVAFDEATLDFVRATHEQIVGFNASIVRQLVNHLPNCNLALDPYTEKWPLQPLQRLLEYRPLSDAALTKIANQLEKHPAILYLLSCAPQMVSASAEVVNATIRRMEEQLRGAGAMNSGKGYENLITQLPLSSPQRNLLIFSSALVSIRGILRVLNQLIYQAILDEKPPILNQENVFSIKFTFHATGKGGDLQYQPDEMSGLLCEPMDIFLLKSIPGHGLGIDNLCEVASSGFNFGQETGMNQRALVRLLDENLCPFSSFWQTALNMH